MADEELPLPIEVPWKLASTTQPLQPGGPAETTLSLFFHEPDEELLVGIDPGEKLVYVKVTASISPCSFDPVDSELASAFLAGTLPVLHLQLDLEVTSGAEASGGIRPYFHAAQPLHRRMVETGVVGDNLFEGASDGQFFGKSGSHLYETVESSSRTTTAGGGLSFTVPFTSVNVGASARTTGTDVTSSRDVTQVLDTTTRQASQERRELVSHTTNVENVITLLSAKYVGTPYLRFSLFPRPLQLLSVDPSDPNLWFSQLLRQRSSGIEGIQEFTAVIVVPRGDDFCVNASLRRVCLLDDPPGPPEFGEVLKPDFFQLARMVDYLYGRFPRGTPLDELDLDIASRLPADFRRPIVRLWAFRLDNLISEAVVASPGDTAGLGEATNVNYKHLLEIWLETLRAEYEQELARSPLERGAVLGEDRSLDTCFAEGETGSHGVTSSTTSTRSLVPIDFDRAVDIEIEDVLGVATIRERSLRTVIRWNALSHRVNEYLTNLEGLPGDGSPLENPRVANVLIRRIAKMAPDDERNVPLDAAADSFGLSAEQSAVLADAGAQDLRSVAQALAAAEPIALQNAEAARLREQYAAYEERVVTRRGPEFAPPEPIDFALDPDQATGIRRSIAASLAGGSGYEAPSGD